MTAPVVQLLAPADVRRQLAERALGSLPDLATADAETIGYGLLPSATTGQRTDAVVALARYHAEQDDAAGLADLADDTVWAVGDVLAGLTGLPAVASADCWETLTEHAAEVLYLESLRADGRAPRYATPAGGRPVTGEEAARARDCEIASRREGMRAAAVHLVGLRERRTGVAR